MQDNEICTVEIVCYISLDRKHTLIFQQGQLMYFTMIMRDRLPSLDSGGTKLGGMKVFDIFYNQDIEYIQYYFVPLFD